MEQKYIIALEIGSSKIRGASGTFNPATGNVTVKAVEEEKLVDCVRYGCIQNVAEVTNRVRSIIDRLEKRDPQRHITGVYVAIGGRSVSTTNSVFERRFTTETEITRDIINGLFAEARATAIAGRDVIDVTSREYRVDGASVSRPVGTVGRSIQATLNMVTARPQLKRNIYSVVRDRIGLKVNGCVVRQLALANVVLSLEDMRLGSMLVDFGAETTTVSIYRGGTLRYLATIPLGSRNITRDITHLNHLEENAEILKKNNGNAMPASQGGSYGYYDSQDSYGGDFVEMNNYVVARVGEIIENIVAQLKYAGLDTGKIPSGVVVVGSGARLKGFNERLEESLGVRVRIGTPMNIVLQDPAINLSEAVDVISVLHSAAINGAVNCSELIQQPKPVVEVQPEPDVTREAEPEPEPVRREEPRRGTPTRQAAPEQPKQPRTSRFARQFEKLRSGFIRVMTDDDVDEFESNDN